MFQKKFYSQSAKTNEIGIPNAINALFIVEKAVDVKAIDVRIKDI